MNYLERQRVFFQFSIYSPVNSGKEVFSKYCDHLNVLIRSYIFQRGVLEINVSKGVDLRGDFYCYSGSVDTGLNMEDEFFMTKFFLLLSKEFPSIVIRVWDSDGEFLLLEIFEQIDWLNPSNSDNRLFIKDGHFYFVNLENAEIVKTPVDGIKKIGEKPSEFDALLKEKLPKEQVMYSIRCILPLKLIWLLRKYPQFLSFATNTLEEAKRSRKTTKMERFKFEDCVECMVTFPKLLFYLLYLQSDTLVPKEVMEKVEKDDVNAKMLGFKLFLGFSLYFESLSKENMQFLECEEYPSKEEFEKEEKITKDDKIEWPKNKVEMNENEMKKISEQMIEDVKEWMKDDGEGGGDVDEEMIKLMEQMDGELSRKDDLGRVDNLENLEEFMKENFQMGLLLEKSMGQVGPSQSLFSSMEKKK